MQSEELLQLTIDALDDLKATDIVELDIREMTDIADFMVIASGRSSRQVIAIAEHLAVQSKHQGHAPIGVEGLREGEWVLVDLCDVIVHVMQPQTREFYQLEKLWGGRDGRNRRPPREASR